MTVPSNLPSDPLGYRFSGVADLKAGGVQQGSSEYATADVRLMAADGQTPLTSFPVSLTAGAGAEAVDRGDGTDDEQAVASAAGLRLLGFACKETTGSAGSAFNLRNGTSNAGALLYTVTLGANESRGEWFGPDGIAAASGIWLERTDGNTTVVVFWKVVA